MHLTRLAKLNTVIAVAVGLFSCAALAAAQDRPAQQVADTAGGAPMITFPEKDHDFGTVPRNSTQEHVFKIRNEGIAPLTLIKAQAG